MRYWCNHCYKVVDIVKKRGSADNYLSCPFCGAFEWDLFPVKKNGILVPPGASHGDYIGYPEPEAGSPIGKPKRKRKGA